MSQAMPGGYAGGHAAAPATLQGAPDSWLSRRAADALALREACRSLGVALPVGILRLAGLLLRHKYSPKEIFLLDLLDGRLARHPGAYISKERMLALQRALNAAGETQWTEDKLCFFEKCLAHGLPTPKVLASCARDGGARGSDAQAFARTIASAELGDVVVKPIAGVHGEGVLLLRAERGRMLDAQGMVWDAAALLAHLAAGDYSEWMAQERLYPHRALRALTGSDTLATLRVSTLLDADGSARVLYARLRIPYGTAGADNFAYGAGGNLVGQADLASGRLRYVLQSGPGGIGLQRLRRHPGSGQLLIGCSIPRYREAIELVSAAARLFAPLKTIGWDVGITDAGACLIEGNVTWDPGAMLDSWEPIVGMLMRALDG